jgi:osmoprotectant transport system permease protein
MNYFIEALAWIADPAHWAGPDGIPVRVAEQVGISALVIVISAVIAIPLGFLVGHTGRGREFVVLASGAARALPTLGLLVIVALNVGIGLIAPVTALCVLAIPSILAGAYAGFEAVDRATIDAARAVGMTELQVVGKVEIPLGLTLLFGGLRTASLQVIATATLAAYVGSGGLGGYIFSGLKTGDYPKMLAGSILVIVLCLLSEGIFAIAQRLSVPRGVVAAADSNVRERPTGSRAVMGSPIQEGR